MAGAGQHVGAGAGAGQHEGAGAGAGQQAEPPRRLNNLQNPASALGAVIANKTATAVKDRTERSIEFSQSEERWAD